VAKKHDFTKTEFHDEVKKHDFTTRKHETHDSTSNVFTENSGNSGKIQGNSGKVRRAPLPICGLRACAAEIVGMEFQMVRIILGDLGPNCKPVGDTITTVLPLVNREAFEKLVHARSNRQGGRQRRADGPQPVRMYLHTHSVLRVQASGFRAYGLGFKRKEGPDFCGILGGRQPPLNKLLQISSQWADF